MNPSGGNPGLNKLAQVLDGRSGERELSGSALVLDFGTIQADMSLLTDTFPVPIPRSDYLVCRHLTLGGTGSALGGTDVSGVHTHEGGDHRHDGGDHGGHVGGDGTHLHTGGEHTHSGDGDHAHTALVPEKMRSPRPGDRVLVAWRGEDAIVIDLIVPAAEMG